MNQSLAYGTRRDAAADFALTLNLKAAIVAAGRRDVQPTAPAKRPRRESGA
jgi:hypothetical protein